MNWLCWHVGTVTDPKIRIISRQSKLPIQTIIASWAVFLEVAAAASRRGWLENFGPLELSASLDVSQEEAESIFVCFVSRGLITAQGQILNWDKRQHGNNAERMRKKRHMTELVRTSAQELSLVRKSSPTVHNSTVQVLETDTSTENNSDKGESDINSSGSRKKLREPASPLPATWLPSKDQIQFAERMGLVNGSVDREAAKFLAYWTTGRGAGTRRTPKGWNQTWINWINKAADEPRNSRTQNHGTASGTRRPVGNPFIETILDGTVESYGSTGGRSGETS